jgi:hypothetical protein
MPRGRTSAQQQLASISPFVPGRRPEPPDDLDDIEVAIWIATLAPLPADWIKGESLPLLKCYCQHVRYSDDIDRDIKALRQEQEAAAQPQPEPDPPLTDKERVRVQREAAKAAAARRRELRALYRAHGYQTARASSLAGKLRISTSSQLRAEKARDDRRDSSSDAVKPWNDYGPGRGQ